MRIVILGDQYRLYAIVSIKCCVCIFSSPTYRAVPPPNHRFIDPKVCSTWYLALLMCLVLKKVVSLYNTKCHWGILLILNSTLGIATQLFFLRRVYACILGWHVSPSRVVRHEALVYP